MKTEVQTESPRIDDYVESLLDNLAQARSELNRVRNQIADLVAADEAARTAISVDHERSRVAGRISLYLESTSTQKAANRQNVLEELRRQVEDLEENADTENRKERLGIEQQRVGALATKLMADLPFEEDYRNGTVYFSARNAECGVITERRTYPMRGVGSDKNYLTLHVSVLCALHEHLANINSPMPGVLFFDQISRPYYPPEETPEGVEIGRDEDTEAVYRYFDFLFKEAERQTGLQIIVLEHAFLKSHNDFRNAVVRRWTKSMKLIPSNWPRK